MEVDELFKRTKPDIVLHAAAYTTGSKDVVEAPWKHVTTNTIINALVLEACNTHKVEHTVFFSCSVPYQSKDTPQKETDWNPGDEIPKSYFGVGNMKVFTERLCEFYSRLGGKFTAIRNSNIYGPWDKTDFDKCHMLPAQIRKVCEATNTLEVWGDGVSTKRDVLYVSDVVGLVDAVINNQKKNYELFKWK